MRKDVSAGGATAIRKRDFQNAVADADGSILLRPVRMPVHIRPLDSDLEVLKKIFLKDVYGPAGRLVPDCRHIIDLGGNIGLAALCFSVACPDSIVFSVEPFTENVDLMRSNLGGLISAGRCRILQAAWDKSEGVEICRPKRPCGFSELVVQAPAGWRFENGGTGSADGGHFGSFRLRRGGPGEDRH
jgi:hypothetical protein